MAYSKTKVSHKVLTKILYIGCLFIGASNSFVLPQCMRQMAIGDAGVAAILISICFAVTNIGIFLAPIFTIMNRMKKTGHS